MDKIKQQLLELFIVKGKTACVANHSENKHLSKTMAIKNPSKVFEHNLVQPTGERTVN